MIDIENKNEIQKILEEQKYIPSKEIIFTLYNAIKLNMPILVEGPAGVGKTELAKVLSDAFNLELLRVQCYEGIDFSKVIYEYNYAKQMLMINALQSKIKDDLKELDINDSINKFGENTNFFDERFLLKRPLLKAIDTTETKILLIDEVDKSDEEFEALLLEFLGEFSITIPELKTIKCDENKKPIIILTSNSKRELSDALRRRCAYLYIDYPKEEIEAKIIESKANVDDEFSKKVSKAVANIRLLNNVKQKPSIAESIIWAKSLLMNLGIEEFNKENKEEIDLTLNLLLKNKRDIDYVKKSNYLNGI